MIPAALNGYFLHNRAGGEWQVAGGRIKKWGRSVTGPVVPTSTMSRIEDPGQNIY